MNASTIPGRRALQVATVAAVAAYCLCGFVLLVVTTTLRPGSDAAAGVLLLGEGLAGTLGLVTSTLSIVSIVARSRANVPFSWQSFVVLLAGLGMLGIAPLVSVGYIVATTPFV